MSQELYDQMKQSVIDGEVEDAERLAREGLDAGLAPGDVLDKGFVRGSFNLERVMEAVTKPQGGGN